MNIFNSYKFRKSSITTSKHIWKKIAPWLQTYTFLILEAIAIFFIVSVLLFVVIDAIYVETGRDQFLIIQKTADRNFTEADLIVLEERYRLTGAFAERYQFFLDNFWTGALSSYRIQLGVDVTNIVSERFLTSFKLGIFGLVIGVALGTVVGLLAGKKPGGLLDKVVSSYVVVVLSLPVFVTGLLLQFISYETGNFNIVYNETNVATWLLPIFSLAIPIIATYARFLKTTVAEELVGNYVNLAKSKGVSSTGIAFKHVLKPSMYPLVTSLPFAVLFAFSGAIVTESVFGIDGAGGIFLRAIQSNDTWVTMYLVMVYTLISLVAFVVRDLSYPLIDPQAKVDVGFLKRRA